MGTYIHSVVTASPEPSKEQVNAILTHLHIDLNKVAEAIEKIKKGESSVYSAFYGIWGDSYIGLEENPYKYFRLVKEEGSDIYSEIEELSKAFPDIEFRLVSYDEGSGERGQEEGIDYFLNGKAESEQARDDAELKEMINSFPENSIERIIAESNLVDNAHEKDEIIKIVKKIRKLGDSEIEVS